MNDTWKTFLLQQGAVYAAEGLVHFGNPQRERAAFSGGNLLVALPSWSLLRARGADAKTFLNAQLTNDLGLVDADHSQLSAWCSAQGRMSVVFRVFLRSDDYFLQLPTVLREETLKRLRMFVLRSKVTLESVDDELVSFGLIGPDAVALLHAAIGAVSSADNAVMTSDAVTVIRVAGIQPRFVLTALVTEAMPLWEKLKPQAATSGPDAWSWHDIMAGIPAVWPQTKEMFVPQMANLELVGGVNFKKGCYPGQEIVARLQYLGRLKQRTYRAHVAAEVPAPGTPIFAPNSDGQSVGSVMSAVASPEGGTDLLAVVQIAAAQAGKLYLASEAGPALEIRALPYAVEGPAT